MGCLEQTFHGLAGIGDLIVTATSVHSRNFKCGTLIGQGYNVDDATKEVGMVVEGLNALPAAMQLAKRYDVEMPITAMVDAIVKGKVSPNEAVKALMNRDRKTELTKSVADINFENSIIKSKRGLGMKRVITYGTFDLLHYGHINLLKRAKALGDYLIVAVSTDEFTRLKKDKKCYFSYEQRKGLLESVRFVDLVIPEENWDQKIKDIKEYMNLCSLGNSTLKQRKEIFVKQKEEVLQEMEKLQKVLSMLNYKCWYYDQAIEKEDEGYVQALSFEQLPPQIQQYYQHSHEDC